MRRRRGKPPEDPLVHRARRATLEGRRLLAGAAAPHPGEAAAAEAGPMPRTAVLATMSELVVVLRELMAERDRLGAELETIDRQSRAASAYRSAGALYALPPRAKRS
ncbi:hypothetical protein PQJ75_27285 [Rhodoplanes sp. TEM]|uniref:Uncharacterized protein n=1 Tax=Rhodoplanes tepidamans TaxID=200616 RepID=A0ABT5JAS1_RHOTP|nr:MULTISPECIES: hypothetical protein [Rhodoplanes]MDC7786780.1 hypothetical protein [Rhodoplanes tepidamans]MDC7987454.1 hypothetical protein [Rhodoplanes sp. TEM]MDQ0356335.1 hypothetical protein [Rhodoplanes tepidamans]